MRWVFTKGKMILITEQTKVGQIWGSGELPVKYQALRSKEPITEWTQWKWSFSHSWFWNKRNKIKLIFKRGIKIKGIKYITQARKYIKCKIPNFLRKREQNFTLRYVQILFKFTGEKNCILRNVSTFQNVSFSISLALARSTGSTTVHAWLPNDCQIPRLLQVLGRKPTALWNFLIRKLLDLGQTAIIQACCLSGCLIKLLNSMAIWLMPVLENQISSKKVLPNVCRKSFPQLSDVFLLTLFFMELIQGRGKHRSVSQSTTSGTVMLASRCF